MQKANYLKKHTFNISEVISYDEYRMFKIEMMIKLCAIFDTIFIHNCFNFLISCYRTRYNIACNIIIIVFSYMNTHECIKLIDRRSRCKFAII